MTEDFTTSDQVTIALFNPLSGHLDVIATGGAEVLNSAISELDYRLEWIEKIGAIGYRDADMVRMVVTVEAGGHSLEDSTVESVGRIARLGRTAGISILAVENNLDNTVLEEVSV